MADTVTIRIEDKLQERLARVCTESGRTGSDIVREALERQLSLVEFAQARQRVRPYAERVGWLTDEDVFDAVS